MRKASQMRKTNETEVRVELNLDGCGNKKIDTGIRFFNHMLEQLAAHSGFDLEISVVSHDSDNHHIVEDVAITLGTVFKEALGDKKGIKRYGSTFLPMDEALALTVVDLSGRAFCKTDVCVKDEKTSDFETVLLAHFFSSFASASQSTIHIKVFDGTDTHHIIEAVFKSFARTLGSCCEPDPKNKGVIPSTKGVL